MVGNLEFKVGVKKGQRLGVIIKKGKCFSMPKNEALAVKQMYVEPYCISGSSSIMKNGSSMMIKTGIEPSSSLITKPILEGSIETHCSTNVYEINRSMIPSKHPAARNGSYKTSFPDIKTYTNLKSQKVDALKSCKFSPEGVNNNDTSIFSKSSKKKSDAVPLDRNYTNVKTPSSRRNLLKSSYNSRNTCKSIDKPILKNEVSKVVKDGEQEPSTAVKSPDVKSGFQRLTKKSSVEGPKQSSDRSDTKASTECKTNEVIIHVVDPVNGNKRDFVLNQQLLMTEMKFFEKYTRQYMNSKQYKNVGGKSDNKFALLDELDITVQCQIEVFKWLLNYISSNEKPVLDIKNVSSILVSADSLIMKELVQECLQYISTHLKDIVILNENTPPYKSHLAKELSKLVSIDLLDSLGDRKNYLVSRLYKKKLETFFEDSQNLLCRCVKCNDLFTKDQTEYLLCPKTEEVFINYKGEVIPQHCLDCNFDLNEYVMILRENKLQWKQIYWKLWATTIMFFCTTCQKYFRAIDYDECKYHNEEVIYYYGSSQGRYLCCSQQSHRFNSDCLSLSPGCKNKTHNIDMTHYSVKKNDVEQFMRNIDCIIESGTNKIKYEGIVKDALSSLKNLELETSTEIIEADSVFTPRTSKFLQMKDEDFSVPQPPVPRKDVVSQGKNVRLKVEVDDQTKVNLHERKVKKKENMWVQDALRDDDNKCMDMLISNMKKLRK